MKWLLVLGALVAAWLTDCVRYGTTPKGLLFVDAPEIYLVPQGYMGELSVVHYIPDGSDVEYEGEARVYRFPSSGILLTKAPASRYKNARYYYIDGHGVRTEIDDWVGVVESEWERRNPKQAAIRRTSRSTYEQINPPCAIPVTEVFIGSNDFGKDYADKIRHPEHSFYPLDDYLKQHPVTCPPGAPPPVTDATPP